MAKVSKFNCVVCGEPLSPAQRQCPMCDTPIASPDETNAMRAATNDRAPSVAMPSLPVKEPTAAADEPKNEPSPDIRRAEEIIDSQPRTPAEVTRAEWSKRAEQKTQADAEPAKTKSFIAPSAGKIVPKKRAPQVEKARRTSGQIRDEAAVDPGLRFVIVASLLIVLALIIMFLGKVV